MKVNFTIDQEPVGKGRPRFTKSGHTYTDEKTKIYENWVKLLYGTTVKYYFEGPVKMKIKGFYKIPKSATKKNKQLMLEGTIRPCKKPDIDNCIKAIADALNEVAYKDDTQIVEITALKYYSDNPRVEVEIEDI